MNFLLFWILSIVSSVSINFCHTILIKKELKKEGYIFNKKIRRKLFNIINLETYREFFIMIIIPYFNIIEELQKIDYYNKYKEFIIDELIENNVINSINPKHRKIKYNQEIDQDSPGEDTISIESKTIDEDNVLIENNISNKNNKILVLRKDEKHDGR